MPPIFDDDLSNITILLVDDDQDALDLLGTVMDRTGYKHIQCEDGQSAIKVMTEKWRTIDVVILDLMMPGEYDGYEVCDWLHKNPKTSNIPVVVLSAKSSTNDKAKSYAAGAFQHLSKPYDVQHLTAVVKSMVRLRRLEREATSNAERLRVILDSSPLEMILITPEREILEMNQTFREAVPNAAIGDSLMETVYDEPPEFEDCDPFEKAITTGERAIGTIVGFRKGKQVYRRSCLAPLKDESGNVVALVDSTQDITKEREMQAHLQRQIERHNRALHQQDMMAEHLMDVQRELKQKNRELEDAKAKLEALSVTDELTGLFNRRYLTHAIEQEARRSSRYQHPLAVLMLDIDHFKNVNDTYGHPAGDRILADIGAILMHQLRETDTIIRYGGEEFLAILPESDRATATSIGERLRVAVEENETRLENGNVLKVTISVGTVSVTGKDINGGKLIEIADQALYKAKQNGRNRVITSDHS